MFLSETVWLKHRYRPNKCIGILQSHSQFDDLHIIVYFILEVESFVLFFWVNRQDRLVQSVLQPLSTALWVRDVSDRALL